MVPQRDNMIIRGDEILFDTINSEKNYAIYC